MQLTNEPALDEMRFGAEHSAAGAVRSAPSARRLAQPTSPRAAADAVARSLHAIRNLRDLDTVLEVLLGEIMLALAAETGAVLLATRSGALTTRTLILRHETLTDPSDVRRGELGDPVTLAAAERWRAGGEERLAWMDVATPGAWLLESHRAWFGRTGHRRVGKVPLFLGDVLVGIIIVATARASDEPDAARRAQALTLAQHVALAVRIADLSDQGRAADLARERARAAEIHAADLVVANTALSRSIALLKDLGSLEPCLEATVQELLRATGARCGAVYLHSAPEERLVCSLLIADGCRVELESTSDAAPFREPIAAAGHYLWSAMQRHEVYWWRYDSPDSRHSPRFRDWDHAHGHAFAAAVPMLWGDTAIGFLGLAFDGTHGEPSAQRVELCRSLAQQAALAIRLNDLAAVTREAAVLGERTRLARDLHDSLAQGLAGIALQLQAALDSPSPADSARFVRHSLELARRCVVDARGAVHALRSPLAHGLDLAASIDAAAKLVFAGSATCVRVRVHGPRRRFDEDTEYELLQIATEAATNTLKHAGARNFRVRVDFGASGVRLRIADDGRGYDGARPPEGFGIAGMRERAARVHASFDMRSVQGRGTTICIEAGDAGRARGANGVAP